MVNTDIELMPYLQFQGNCEDALNFYKDILNGQIEIASRYDNPAMNVPEDFKNKILHARFTFGKYAMFASDVMPKKMNESIHYEYIHCRSVFMMKMRHIIFLTGLAQGGEIHIPFKKQFWGDWHGNFYRSVWYSLDGKLF